jgi:hypothetical protein
MESSPREERLVSTRDLPRLAIRGVLWTIATLVVSLFVGVGAQAAQLKPGAVAGASQKLVPGLQRITTPAVRSASPAAQARHMSLPARGPGSPVRLGSRVVVTARVSSTAPAVVHTLRDAGAQILTTSARYGMITVAVAPADLERIAALSPVRSVMPALQPLTAAEGGAGPSSPAIPSVLTCPWGSVRSEGDSQLHADHARSAFGIDGSGPKVGIISDSFNTATSAVTHASDDVSNGDLPGAGNPCGFTSPVQDLLDSPGGSDEGRAMAQVVHDLAPEAPLAFESAAAATVTFPQAVSALRSSGAKVIVDDVTFLDEPFFQDGPDAVAVNNAAAAGIPYFSAAANNNVFDDSGDNVSSWEAPSYRPTACPTTPDFSANGYLDCMDFAPSGGASNGETFTLGPDASFGLDLQWSEPWFGVNTDLDVFLLDSSGNILAGSDDTNPSVSGTQEPVEFFSYANTTGADQTVKLVIARFPSDTPGIPRLKYALIGAAGISNVQFPTSSGGDIVGPAIFGHNGAPGAMSVAAVPFDDSSMVEPFSSRGPVTHYLGPVTSATPAAPLGSPETLAKPDAAATDGAATSFFAQQIDGVWRFFGTSEAAPHAAALAAVLLQAYPRATVAQIYNDLKSTAVQVGSFGADAEGAGLLDAFTAVNSGVAGSPTAAFAFSPPGPVAGNSLSFDGSGSTDPNTGAVITKYTWNFGDGTASSGPSPSVSHAYVNPGTYTVSLTVADSVAQTAAVSRAVTIAAPPPPPVQPPAPTPTPVPRVVCKVPNVKRKSLAAARRALRAHHCAVGRLTSPHKPRRSPGKHKKWVRVVRRESPAAGRTLRAGSKVALTLTWRAVKK